MTGFVQIIEFRTSRADDIRKLADEVTADPGESTVLKATITQDRAQPGRYFNIIEFDSYESAMQNSKRPETSEFAAKMAELCDGPATFYDLDVVDIWSR